MFEVLAHIHRNNQNLRDSLDNLGYSPLHEDGECWGPYLMTQGKFYISYCGTAYEIEGSYDCGESEDLFLGLAALRNDTDYLQWFIIETPEGKGWFLYTTRDRILSDYTRDNPSPIRKATPQELYGHFTENT